MACRRACAWRSPRCESGKACRRSDLSYLLTFEFGDLVNWRVGDFNSPIHQLTKLPTTLCHSRDVPFERELTEAEAAQRELPHVGARAAAQVTPVAQSDLVFRRLGFFCDLRGRCHVVQLSAFSYRLSVCA